jgi:hypothetical protein
MRPFANILLLCLQSCCRTALGGLFLLVLVLPSIPCQAQNTRSGKIYTIVLKGGREIKCTSYYERDGQIMVVRSIGVIGYSKEDIAEIRDETRLLGESGSATPSAQPNPVASAGASHAGAGQCAQPGTIEFEREIDRLPRDAAAAEAKISDMISHERQLIADLEIQLPAWQAEEASAKEAKDEAHQAEVQEARRKAEEKADERKKYGPTAEDMKELLLKLSGQSQVEHGNRNPFKDKNAVAEASARIKKEAIEREISQRQCNISWAEKKRSELKK